MLGGSAALASALESNLEATTSNVSEAGGDANIYSSRLKYQHTSDTKSRPPLVDSLWLVLNTEVPY